VPDLTNALLEEWSKIPINTFLNLVESLPRRVEPAMAAKGGPTPYLTLQIKNWISLKLKMLTSNVFFFLFFFFSFLISHIYKRSIYLHKVQIAFFVGPCYLH